MNLRALCTSLLIVGFGAVQVSAALAGPLDKPANDKLSGDAIKATWFNSQPFVATAPDGTAYKMTFNTDGKAFKTPVAKKAPAVSGFWRVIAEGYCVRWTGSVREKCFNIRNEDKVTVARFGKEIVANWSR